MKTARILANNPIVAKHIGANVHSYASYELRDNKYVFIRDFTAGPGLVWEEFFIDNGRIRYSSEKSLYFIRESDDTRPTFEGERQLFKTHKEVLKHMGYQLEGNQIRLSVVKCAR